MSDVNKARQSDALATDLLEGAEEIAEFMFGDRELASRRRIYYLGSECRGAERLPLFRLGTVLCARKSTLLTWIADREARAAAQAGQAA